MGRVFYCKSNGGVSPHGGVIATIQAALNTALQAAVQNYTPILEDGDFGNLTMGAVRQYQALRSLPVTGAVDDRTWSVLMNSQQPDIFERCLQLTAAFEDTGYTMACGNFDGAGVTWGIIGFTLSNGELGTIVNTINSAKPQAIKDAFGDNADVLLHMCDPRTLRSEKISWANSISTQPSKGHLVEPWNASFIKLGKDPDVQAIQKQRAHDEYWVRANNDAAALGMTAELDYALLYDCSVQNGAVVQAERADIVSAFSAENATTLLAKRLIVSRVVAQAAAEQWQQDTLSRKGGISRGIASVHGGTYTLADWALGG
jgi:hypothetical protein